MKITLHIDARLLAEAKALAAQQRTSLTHVVEEGLHLRLRARDAGLPRRRARLPVFSGRGGLVAGVDACSILLRSEPMTDTAQALTEAALKLPPEDRERLVEKLIASLDQGPALHPDWHDEIVHRLANMQAGRTRFIPVDEAMARLTAHIHARRPAA